jgi:signal transduction histidine kinase
MLWDTIRRWLFPIFWTLVFCVAVALSTLALVQSDPTLAQGWRGLELGALLAANIVGFGLVAWHWLYTRSASGVRRGALLFCAELLALALLVWRSSGLMGWIALALLYPVFGGLPRRRWPASIAALLAIYAWGVYLGDPGLGAAAITGAVMALALNVGLALGLRTLSAQRDQLCAALEELAASAAQREELAVLRERARLARAMHDDLGHALALVSVRLEVAQMLYGRDPERGASELEGTRALVRATTADLRRALADLREPSPAFDRLPEAIQRLADDARARSGLHVECALDAELQPLAPEAREALWYVAREALLNVERHASAQRAVLTLARQGADVLLSVADDGVGLSPADLGRHAHYGVIGMRERISAVGGQLELFYNRPSGTVVQARLPQAPGCDPDE